jgi:hypothetical protein
MLHISDPTLTYRLVKACGLGLVTPEIDEQETSIGDQYRPSERGALVVKTLEQSGVTHAYRTMLDMHQQVKDGRSDLDGWLDDEETEAKLARCNDQDPYVDPFGEDLTEYSE